MQDLQLPPPLQEGDLLRAVAPSGALRERELGDWERGLDIWRDRGYELELSQHHGAREGYLAGSDRLRRQSLREAWLDPECKGILCVRGGYGSARLLENWQWESIPAPKWLIGFSDITGLLWSLYRRGISGVHGPVLTTIAREPQWSRARLFDFLAGKPLPPLKGNGWGGGKARGILLPANLTVATHLLGTPLCPDFAGVILALEDVREAPYKIDRMLTQWRMSGAFRLVKAIALGRFSNCQAPEGIPSWTAGEVLRDRLGDLNLPIVSDLPFGHEGANAALPVGQPVELDGDAGSLSFLARSEQSVHQLH